MDGSSSNSLANSSAVSQDLDNSSSAASDQCLYHDLPQGLIEAEERRRQSMESYSSETGDGKGRFEKPAPIANTYSQNISNTYSVQEPKQEHDRSILEEYNNLDNHSKQRMESLMQENRVLKCELETYKLKIKTLQEENRHLRQDAVQIQAKAEQEEEFISNTLLKKIQVLKKEKENLAINYEQEEEYLTNDLSRKLDQLRQEKVQLEHTLEQEQECLVNKLMRRIEKLESETTSKQVSLEALRREKVELENTLEQEQEALVNKLWKRMDHLEKEKRALQVKLDKPVSEPQSPRSVNDFNYGGGTAANIAKSIRGLKKECARLKQQLIVGKEEHERKMAEYAKEEKEVKDENLRLQRRLQLEVERREALCRQLSESESSIEMDEERAYNELSLSGQGNISTSSIGSFNAGILARNRTRSISSENAGPTEESSLAPLSTSYTATMQMNQRAPSPSQSFTLPQTNAPFSHLPKAGNSYAVHPPSTFVRPTSTVQKGSSHSVPIASSTNDNSSLMETGDEMYQSPRSGRKCTTPAEKESVIRASTPTLSPLTIQSSSFIGSEDDKAKRDLNL